MVELWMVSASDVCGLEADGVHVGHRSKLSHPGGTFRQLV